MKILFLTGRKKTGHNRSLLHCFPVLLLLCFAINVHAGEAYAGSQSTGSVAGKVQKTSVNKIDKEPLKKNSNSYLLQLFSGLIIVLLCIIVLAWVAKRFNRIPSRANAYVQILGGVSMGSRERVVVVKAGNKKLLLGVSPGRINMLHVLEEGDDISVDEKQTIQRNTQERMVKNTDNEIASTLTGADLTSGKTRTFSQNLAAALIRKKS